MAQTPVYTNEPSGEFMREWLLCGPFPSPHIAEDRGEAKGTSRLGEDFLSGHGGETNPHVAEGQVERFDETGTAVWKRYTSPEDIIGLDEAISEDVEVLAYAYCEVESAQEQACLVSVGSNDGGRVWLNGELLIDSPGPRGLQPDQDTAPGLLRKGRNTLLLKIEEWGHLWQFCCRLRPFDAQTAAQHKAPFTAMADKSGRPSLRLNYAEEVGRGIIESASFRVLSPAGGTVWESGWSGQAATPIGVPADTYAEYRLEGEVVFKGGARIALSQAFSAGPRVEHVLFDNGQTDYVIVVSPEASESEKWAAKELAHWLGEVSGATFPVRDSAAKGDKCIVAGVNETAKALLPDIETTAADDESFTYRSIGGDIVIWGGSQRGTMYGVMDFLEEQFGCRWYTPSVSVAPKRARYVFDYIHHAEAPGVRVRNDFYFEAFDPVWAARNRINGALGYREQIGGVEPYWRVHTFETFVPVAEFYSEHPEYFSLIDGKRTSDHTQLCLTNPDVLAVTIERLKKVMRDEPQFLIYSVSQNDWRNPCQCDACQAITKREDSEAGPLIHFVNQVADAVRDEFPNKYVGTLAYQYTRKPPAALKPRDNVVIRLCSIECCFAHDFLSCEQNASFVEDTKGWAAIAPHLYIWDYVVNFANYLLPFPNFKVLKPNVQFFRDHNAIGIMEQAAYQSRGGEFAELRMNVIARLLWNPECDVDYWVNDFMHGYYGRAGQHVRRYFDLLHAQIRPDTHMPIFFHAGHNLYSDAFIEQAETIFDEAEAVADSGAVLRRVEMARMPVMYLKCLRSPVQAKRDGTYARFCAIAEREGITHYAEKGPPHREQFHETVEAAE